MTAPTLRWNRFLPAPAKEHRCPHATGSARVVNVAAGVENTDRTAPVRGGRHQALTVLIDKWINEGHTAGTAEIPGQRRRPALPLTPSRPV